MKFSFVIAFVLLSSCGMIGRGTKLIPDQSDCIYKYYFFNREANSRTVIRIYQKCKKGWMDYYFDRDSTVWKGNGAPGRRAFEFKLVYDTTYEVILTSAEVELFKRAAIVADSLHIKYIWNLDNATGFVKVIDTLN